MTCHTCEWFVEETDIIGDYQHEKAKCLGEGFCLIKDLFTYARSEDNACEDWVQEKVGK